MKIVPRCHWDDLVGAQPEPSLAAGRVLPQDLVHDAKKLLDPLVQSEVLTTLH